MCDYHRGALLDASRKATLNRRFCELHVSDLDDAIGVHLGLHHLGDLLDQLVRLGASAAMVDQQKCVPSAHGRDVGLRHSCVKNGQCL